MRVALRVRARLFARLREQAGVDSVEVEVPGGATVAGVYEALRLEHPGLGADHSALRPARNQVFCDWDEAVADGDEVAFIPPVSGGRAAAALLEVTTEVLDARRLEEAVRHPGAGAICTFTGIVRDKSRDRSITHLEDEAYRAMAEQQMEAICAEIAQRWPEARVAMAHRTGGIDIGVASVVVSVSCPHRAEAIAACKWGIDRLKESLHLRRGGS